MCAGGAGASWRVWRSADVSRAWGRACVRGVCEPCGESCEGVTNDSRGDGPRGLTDHAQRLASPEGSPRDPPQTRAGDTRRVRLWADCEAWRCARAVKPVFLL